MQLIQSYKETLVWTSANSINLVDARN